MLVHGPERYFLPVWGTNYDYWQLKELKELFKKNDDSKFKFTALRGILDVRKIQNGVFA